MAALPEETLQPERRRALKEWIFANVIRGPIVGDVYTCWHDDHIGYWTVHAITPHHNRCDLQVLLLTDGYNCNIWMHEWDDEVRKGRLRFTGDNLLWK